MTKKYLLPLLLLGAALTASAAPIDDMTAAVEMDNGREVLALLVKGVDANAADQRGRKPLGVALREGSEQAFDALLADPRVDVVAANDKGETPLMLAAIKGRLEWAKKLAARGAKINQPGWTPLHYACSGPDAGGIAAWLLSQGADVNARSPNGTTPLMMAARYGASENVAILLKAGADVALKNEQELTAVDFAKKAGRDLTVKQLLAATPR